MIDATRLRRAGKPEEVAATIVFLASDDAALHHRRDARRQRRAADACTWLSMAEEPGRAAVGDERVDEFTVEGRLLTDVGGTIAAACSRRPG